MKRLVDAEKLNDFEVCPTVRQTSERGGRPSTEFWLNEEAALLVTTQSDTPKAWTLTREIVRVFRLAVRGQLDVAPKADDAIWTMVTALSGEVKALREQVATGARESGTVSGLQADWIRGEVDALANLRVLLGYNRSLGSARMWIRNRIAAATQWAGTGAALRLMPADRYAQARICLAQLRSDLEAEARRRRESGKGERVETPVLQQTLFRRVYAETN